MAEKKQVVEVVFPGSNKTYSYVGSGGLRVGQTIQNAPVNHYISGKPYTAPVEVVATHNLYGVNVGDHIGVTNGRVHSIPKPLKYLPSNKDVLQDREVDIDGREMTTDQYMQPFESKNRLLNYKTQKSNNLVAKQRLLGAK